MIVRIPNTNVSRNVSVSPWAIPCATLCFLASIGAFLILVIYAPHEAEIYLRPLIPSLTTLGGIALLWWRQSRSEVQHSSENAVIIDKADDAASKAEITAEVVDKKLNGDLDKRIAQAIETALSNINTKP